MTTMKDDDDDLFLFDLRHEPADLLRQFDDCTVKTSVSLCLIYDS